MKHAFKIFIFIFFLSLTPAYAMPMPSNGAPDQALLAAIQKGDLEGVKAAFAANAYPNVVMPDGCSALIYASRLNNPSIVQALLDKGADVNYSHETCDSPIYQAANLGNLEVVKLLTQNGAKMDVEVNRKSPLLAAISSRKKSIVQFYLENGGNANKVSEGGSTILIYAASRSSPSIVWLILDHGADINAAENSGFTALMGAAASGNVEIVRTLLERGANPELKNINGQDALAVAKATGNDKGEIGDLLKNAVENRTFSALNPFKEKAELRPYRLIEEAEKGNFSEQYKLGESYYFGLNDSPKNLKEAYYWFSVCDYSTKFAKDISTEDIYKHTLELREKAALKVKTSEDKLRIYINMVSAPQLNKMCNAYLSKKSQELSFVEQGEIAVRLEKWRVKNPEHAFFIKKVNNAHDFFKKISMNSSKQKIRMDDLIPLAESGDKKAQYELGRCYFSNNCEEPVEDILRKLAYQAQQELEQEGNSPQNFRGLDTSVEYRKNAISWLEKSAAQSHAPAYTLLASIYSMQNNRDDTRDLKKSCEMLLAAINAGDFHAYSLVAYMPWNRQTDRKIEEYAWTTVSKVAAGEKMPVEISPYMLKNLSDTELKTAQERARLHIREHVELKKPVCTPADL